MRMEPLVSIIMGAYNCQDTVGKAIESIQNQTYQNWEFVICDDASTDETWMELKKYGESDKRIILIKNDHNLRLAAALNHCLAHAKGEYIARMDADDESYPERLEKQVRFLEQHEEYAVVGCGRVIFDENGDKGVRLVKEVPDRDVLLANAPFAHPTIMMRKSVYDQLGGYTVSELTKRAEDLDLWFRFFHAGYKGYNIQKPLYRYHESLTDYNKRTVDAAWNTSKVYLNGYRLMGFPWYKYVFALKPLISALLPPKMMYWYHNKYRITDKWPV